MLTELRIRNFAIIESLALPLAPGFNVLSGETGAGKSIIVGALSLLLGERGSADLIRTGADRATVEGAFDATDRPELATLLDERGIDVEEGIVVLRREIVGGGRARAWINGTTVTASVLAEVGRQLVNLHGQHESQTLLEQDAQRAILDAFGGSTEAAEQVRHAHADLAMVRSDIASLAARRAGAEKRADYLRHVVAEIEKAHLRTGEDASLDDEARRLAHMEELRGLTEGMIEALADGEEAVLPRLASIQRSLASVLKVDPSLGALQELLDGAFYQLEDLSRELSAYDEGLEADPGRLEEIERRRDLLYRLMQKYGGTIEAVLQTGRGASAELDLLDTASLDLGALATREREALERLTRDAASLTALRGAAADRLARAVDEVLPDLGMPDGHFSVALTERGTIAATGAEDVEFRVTLNRGHDARSIARVASGGELSRVMLALKTILARLDRVPTLVFDEVDAGIGGRVGLQVGETMRRVAAHHQVFAISHLPQLAARAHHHILVTKGARSGVTTADTRVLDGDERIAEIARMLGGDPESEVSRAHARELLATAAGPVVPNGAAARARRRKT